MSSFECVAGHEWGASRGLACPVCGRSVYRMDGMTAKQLYQMEQDEYHREFGPDGDDDREEEIEND